MKRLNRFSKTIAGLLACLILCALCVPVMAEDDNTLALPEYGVTFLLTDAQAQALDGGQYVLTIDEVGGESDRFTYIRFVAYYLSQQALENVEYTMEFLYEQGVHVYDLVIVREDLLETYAPGEDATVVELDREGDYVFQARLYPVENLDQNLILGMMIADGETLTDWALLSEPTAFVNNYTQEKIGSMPLDGSLDIFGEAVPEDLYSRATLTMVNIWGTYCTPCINEMPDLAELAHAYDAGRFQIVGVVTDVGTWEDETAELARAIAEMTGADYVHVVPTQAMLSGPLSAVLYIPTTIFVAADGSVVGEEIVGSHSKEEWETIIEERLAMVEGAN